METAVIDAEWAWLTLSASKEGSASTCCICQAIQTASRNCSRHTILPL